MQRTGWIAIGVGIVSLVGCAAGSESDYEPSSSDLATVPIEAGVDEASSITLPTPQPPPEEDAGSTTTDAGGNATTDAGGGGSTTDAGGGGGGGGGTTSCNATNTCAASTSLGNVSGDTGSDSQFAQGTTSEWLTVRVTENDSSVFAARLKMMATLQSPPGTNFDLYVYVPGSDTLECSAVTTSSTSTTTFDSASVSFGESGTFSNGSQDDRTVTIEVRHVSGTCDPSAKWTLNVYGNQ